LQETKKIKIKSSLGFTLVELLVVVAILGILSAIGVVSYNGYVSATKAKSAENMMQQIGLAETEEYSSYGSYYGNSDTCTESTTEEIGDNLFGSSDYIDRDKMGYDFCILATGSTYTVHAQSIRLDEADNPVCSMTLDSSGKFTKC
jgi:type IV pilus assembly protein PilE